MTVFEPKRRMIQIRDEIGNRLLFLLDPETMKIEIKKGGLTYEVKVHDLISFAQTSQRNVFRALMALETSEDEPVRGQFE
jgi:hypothetical protein